MKRKLCNKVRLRSFLETWLACVASVSVWFRSKRRPRNDEERDFRFWPLLVRCSETARKRFLRRLKSGWQLLIYFTTQMCSTAALRPSRKVTGGTCKNKGHAAAARKRSHQWCVSPTLSNTKTIGRMTCHSFLRPIRRDLPKYSFATQK